jgi:2'-5' RNA ligase
MPSNRPLAPQAKEDSQRYRTAGCSWEKRQFASHYTVPLVSKRTVKRKLRKKKKANHGKKPNCGRG